MISHYQQRIQHYIPFEIKTLPDIKATKSLTQQKQKELEGQKFLEALPQGAHVILLDERGLALTSRKFAEHIQHKMSNLQDNLVFIIGGPYGFSQQVYDRANQLISLSPMTLTHEMVRLLFTEQLYRAQTIIHNQPYHHD